MTCHDPALRALRDAGYRDTIEYIQTLETHKELLREELERVLTLHQSNNVQSQNAKIVERTEAVLKFTRKYSSRQY